MAKTSLPYRKAVLGGNGSSVKNVLDDSVFRFYSGTVPASADDSIGSATTLVEITTSDGAGITFELGDDGVLRKNSNEQWQGTAINTGVATFFRIVKSSDTNGVASTEVRIQGTLGDGYGEIILSNTNIVTGAIIPLNSFSIYLPSSN